MRKVLSPSTKYRDSPEELLQRFPGHTRSLFNRPDLSRRGLFKLGAAGLTGSFLLGKGAYGQELEAPAPLVKNSGMKTQGTAKSVIMIHLVGAMSHTDTLDFKYLTGITPSTFNPTNVNGVDWPMGLLPKLGAHLGDIGIIRSMQAHALVHSLAQTWVQIGRNPAAALGDIAPNIGSMIALEKAGDRKPGQVFPTFIGLNAGAAVGPGYLPASYAPFQVGNPRTGSTGIADTTNANGQTLFNTMFSRLQQYDGAMRTQAPYGSALTDMDTFYAQAKAMMYAPAVDLAFGVSATDGNRYGTGTAATTFGNACLVAKQILAADQGTRFIQIDFGSWDHHQNIYATTGSSVITMGTQLDNGLGALLDDLKSSGLFDSTLVVVVGEFGRTTGNITAAGGRDHYVVQSALLAGGGIKGGKIIGATNAVGTNNPGSVITDFGWAGSGSAGARVVWAEDLESTIYSAMGIDWTTIRYDDPFGRGYEYVPFASIGTYGPVKEIFK